MLSLLAAAGFLLLVGFAAGYGVRELVSRRRRAAARRDYYERQFKKTLMATRTLSPNDTPPIS